MAFIRAILMFSREALAYGAGGSWPCPQIIEWPYAQFFLQTVDTEKRLTTKTTPIANRIDILESFSSIMISWPVSELCSNVLTFMKWSTLQERSSKFNPKTFNGIDNWD